MRRAGALYVLCLAVALAAPAAASPVGRAVRVPRAASARRVVLVAGRAQAFRVTVSTGRTIGLVAIRLGPGSNAKGLTVGVYSDGRGQPGARLAAGSTSSSRPGAWNTITLAPVRLIKAHVYWVAVLLRHGRLDLRVRTGARCASRTSSSRHLTRLPAAWRHSARGHVCPPAFRLLPAAASTTPSPGPTGGGQSSGAPAGAPGGPAAGAAGLRVSANTLTDGGQVVHLHGVNRSGTEYACIQGWGIFDGPSDDAAVAAIARWHANIVRVPINEDCWLGINGVPPAYGGQAYIDALVNYVHALHAHGLYAELSLMWAAPGTAQASYQPAAPDEDHAPAVWQGMAQTFRGDPKVILAPWGETTVSWSCFRNGCNDGATFGSGPWDGDASCGSGCWYYASAGMQQAVSVMRQAGYHGPIAIPCIDYANDCADANGSWVAEMPSDPDNQLLAEAHVYGKNACDSTACLDSTMLPILQAGHPLIFGETGETYDSSDCGSSYISTFIGWADAHGVGYEPWTWDTWGGCGVLISDYNGTPANAYGSWVESHYAALG